jgi:CRISPR/Cas system-associated endoribonuclease Cas2
VNDIIAVTVDFSEDKRTVHSNDFVRKLGGHAIQNSLTAGHTNNEAYLQRRQRSTRALIRSVYSVWS